MTRDLADRSRRSTRGYPGVIAHEYDPTPGRDPVRSLEKVFAITDVLWDGNFAEGRHIGALSSIVPRLGLQYDIAAGHSDAHEAIALGSQRGCQPFFGLHLDFAVEHPCRAGTALPDPAIVRNIDAVHFRDIQ
jgi:hypothetical protein